MTSPTVHGLATDLVAPDWPAPNARELASALDRFGLRLLGAPTWVSPRPLSSGVKVTTDDGPAFVKRQSIAVRTADQLTQEHEFAYWLGSQGVPVPEIISALDGGTAVSIDGWSYEVHRPAAGIDVYRDAMSWTPFNSIRHATAAGRSLATLHLAAADYPAPARDTEHLTSRPESLRASQLAGVIERYLQAEPDLRQVVSTADAKFLETRLQSIGDRLTVLPTQWCHLDWHASNLFWHGDEIACVIDFGLADRSYAVIDLALALERNVIRWLELPETQIGLPIHATELIAGYESVRPLSPTEHELLPELLPVCHLDFALSEVHYFGSLLNDPTRAGIAWRDYAIAHTAWFDTPAGVELLEALR